MPLIDTTLAHFIQCRFRGQTNRTYQVSESEAQRVRELLEDGRDKIFIVEAAHHLVAIAPSALLTINILWEPAALVANQELDPAADHPVLAFFQSSSEPTAVSVVPDVPVGAPGEPDHQPGQLAELLDDLDADFAGRFRAILDEDGEFAILNLDDLAALEVPRIYLDPTCEPARQLSL